MDEIQGMFRCDKSSFLHLSMTLLDSERKADGKDRLACGGVEIGHGNFNGGSEIQGEATADWNVASGDSRRDIDLFFSVVRPLIEEVGIHFDFRPEPSHAAILQSIVQNEPSGKERSWALGRSQPNVP